MADQSRAQRAADPDTPDYELADALGLDDPAQYRAMFEPTRADIIQLLLERAATTSELATALGKPKGTVGHHLKVLTEAGLVHVVRTERIRALEAKYYGRTARVFLYRREHDAVGQEQRVLERASGQVAQALARGRFAMTNTRYARIPADRARQWRIRMEELLMEFACQEPSGDTSVAMLIGLYEVDRPTLSDQTESRPTQEEQR